jgi:hypothetical protein
VDPPPPVDPIIFSGPDGPIVSNPANTATISAVHPSVGKCLGQAAISAGEDLLGLSMLPGSDQDNWQWQNAGWNSGFVYTGAGEVIDASVGVTQSRTQRTS